MESSDSIALASAAVAVCALGVSIWQGYVTREHSILSVTPRLDVHVHISESDDCFIEIKNAGLGLALINAIKIETPSKSIAVTRKADWGRVFKELWGEIPDCQAGYLAPGDETVLAAGGEKRLLTLRADDRSALRDAFRSRVQRSRVIVEYNCIYGRKYSEVFDGEKNAT